MTKLTTMLPKKQCSVCVFFIFLTIAFILSGEGCPCRIDSNAKKADCTGSNLTDVPDCVPRSVKELLLTDNRLFEICPRQFEKFNELWYLDLNYSAITYLSDDAFTGLTALKYLYLHGNNISVLNTTAFSRISKLRELKLTYSNIRVIKENVFSGLLNLNRLELQFNKIQYLSACIFAGLSSLKHLGLSIDLLHSFPLDVFQPLGKLEKLEFYDNDFVKRDTISIDQQLKWLTSLKTLRLSRYLIHILGAGFMYLKNLEELFIPDGYLPAINNETFNNLKNSPLKRLDFDTIPVVYPSTFTSLKYLEDLRLFNSQTLCAGGLYNITVGLSSTNIRILIVAKACNVEWGLSGKFRELKTTHLEFLDLSSSRIGYIESTSFQIFPSSLRDLILEGNNIVYFEFYELGLENLDYLVIASNKGTTEEISDPSMKDANHDFKKQRISNTKILATKNQETNKVFALGHKNLFDSEVSPITRFDENEGRKPSKYSCNYESYSRCYSRPYKLTDINLSNSCLLESVLKILCCTNVLQILSASELIVAKEDQECQFREFWKRIKDLRILEELDVSGNAIREIPSGLFSEQTQLKKLTLSRNLLMDVNFGIQKLSHLEKLDLSDNMISYIPSQFSQQIETIAKHSNLTVHLHGNILSCKCDERDFVTWLLHTRVIFRKDNLTCKYRNGTELALSRIADIHRQLESECFAFQVLLGSIVGFIILILTLSVVAVTCHKRWRFEYLSWIRRRNINPYHPIEDREILLEYDIYISYDRDHVVSSDVTLHDLVTQRIYPSLKQRGLKIIIREELDIGRKLFEVISHALRRSRKVVILLSNKYCKDHWNLFEFNMSVMEGIYTKREVVVPVMLETLKPEDLNKEVYAFLRSGPVARFTFDRNLSDLINFLFESAR